MVKVVSKGDRISPRELRRKKFMDIVTQGAWECGTCGSVVNFEHQDRVRNGLAERAVESACPVCEGVRQFYRPSDT